jgi:energy-coupling factor transport system permease protein
MSALVQYVPGRTLFHRLDPRAKIVGMLLVSGVVFVVKSLWVASAILLTLILIWFLAGLPGSMLRGLVRALAGIMVFLLIVQGLLYPGETILVQPIIPSSIPLIGGAGRVTLEGILFAVLLSARLMAMVILMPLVTVTTPMHEFLLGLVRMGLPYRLAYTVTTALNLIPTLQAEANAVADAQRLRAFQVFDKGNLPQKLKAYPALVTPLVIGAMRRAQLVAVAMDSRAFGSAADRTYIHDIRMRAMDWAFVAGSVLYTALAGLMNVLLT